MRKKVVEPTPENLALYLRLDADTGEVFWKADQWRSKSGDRAGSFCKVGYRYIGFFGRSIPEHRVVFALYHGRMPSGPIDHIDRDKLNNRPSNLRECTKAQNAKNVSRSVVTASGYEGVYRRRRKWVATVRDGGRARHIGMFDTPEAAHAARSVVMKQIYGDQFC